MEKPRNYQWTEKFLLVLILCSVCFLLLGNLGNQYLWQDEAQTALVSKTILEHGVPRGYDGKNFFSQELEAEYGEDYIWKWHPWLSFYVLAAFFKVFGVGTFVARLPFALFGIATVFLTYAFCKRLWQSRAVAAVAALLLLTSVPFLLLSRQCRYYSMSAFFSLWCLYAYAGLVYNGKKLASLALAAALTLLFHTHYAFCVPVAATVILHTVLFHRRRLITVLLTVAAAALINVPWVFWFSTIKYGQQYGSDVLAVGKLLFFTTLLITKLFGNLFPPYLLAAVPIACLGTKKTTGSFISRDYQFWQRLLLLGFFIVFNIVLLVFVSPYPFIRYLAPCVPVLAVITALLVVATARVHPVIALAVVLLLICTSSFKDFLYEITHDYDGPIEGIVNYLNENGGDDDVVAITYGDMPLKFYTNMRIVGGLTGQELSPARQAEWVVLRKYTICEKDAAVREYLRQNVPWHNYEKIEIDYPDIPFENREEPLQHHFRTVTDEDKVAIHRRISL